MSKPRVTGQMSINGTGNSNTDLPADRKFYVQSVQVIKSFPFLIPGLSHSEMYKLLHHLSIDCDYGLK